MEFYREKDNYNLEYIQINLSEELDLSDLHRDLRRIMIVGYPMSTIPTVKHLKSLEALWLISCEITDAENVVFCHLLRQLFLHSNSLRSIPTLNQHPHLKVLWLGGNNIESIQACELPMTLEELNLAGNRLTTIRNSFTKNCKLKMLNLAGNPLQSIFEIYHLKNLRHLKHLVLCDPLYEVCGIGKLRAYRSFIIITLPQLKQLDFFYIEDLEVELTKTYYENKDLFYRMFKSKILYEYYSEIERIFQNAANSLSEIKYKLYSLNCKENKNSGTSKIPDSDTCRYLNKKLQEELDGWRKQNNYDKQDLKRCLEVKLNRLNVEQKYFGNIKFEEFQSDSEAVLLIQNILKSFICPYMEKRHRIEGIKVLQMTLVLYSRYELHEDLQMIMDVLSEKETAKLFIKSEQNNIKNTNETFHRYVAHPIICNEDCEMGQTVTQCFLLNGSSHEDHQTTRVASLLFLSENDSYLIQSAMHGEGKMPFRCEVRRLLRRREYMPYLLIDYEYTYKEEDNFANLSKRQYAALTTREQQMNPYRTFEYKSWNTVRKLSFKHQSLNKFGIKGPYMNILELDVSYNEFENFDEIFHLFPHLEILNISFNKILSLEPTSIMKRLREINMSWNLLTSLISTLEWLEHYTPEVNKLNLQFNLFMDLHEESHEIYLVSIYLKNLIEYNGSQVSENISSDTDSFYAFKKDSLLQILISSDDYINFELEKMSSTEKSYVILNNNNDIKSANMVKGNQFRNIRFQCYTKYLTSLKISQNKLMDASFLEIIPSLVHVDLSFNMLTTMSGSLQGLKKMETLNLAGNYLISLENHGILELPSLKILDISKNCLKSLYDIQYCKKLEELYIGYNKIHKVDNYTFIKTFKDLKIIDVRENGIIDMEIIRNYLVFHNSNLQYINGTTVTEEEISEANNDFGGVLDYEYLESLNKLEDITTVDHLSILNSSIKRVSLKEVSFKSLTSLNLENNGLETVSEFTPLENLKILCLTGNQVCKFGDITTNIATFKQLEELHLNSNNIDDLQPLEFYRMPKLRNLFLQDNNLTAIIGLKGLLNLQTLILDNNKINKVEGSHVRDLINITGFHIHSNYIDSLEFLEEVEKIEHLHLSNNRIKEVKTLKFLKNMTHLENITLTGNPIFKNVDGYVQLLFYLPEVSIVDGVSIEMYREEEEIDNE